MSFRRMDAVVLTVASGLTHTLCPAQSHGHLSVHLLCDKHAVWHATTTVLMWRWHIVGCHTPALHLLTDECVVITDAWRNAMKQAVRAESGHTEVYLHRFPSSSCHVSVAIVVWRWQNRWPSLHHLHFYLKRFRIPLSKISNISPCVFASVLIEMSSFSWAGACCRR